MDQDVTEILKETIYRLLQSLREVVDEGGEILENLKKVNIKDIHWTTQLGRMWSKTNER
jgi:pilus assembly protein TadC